MASIVTNYQGNLFLQALINAGSLYLGLFLADPGVTGSFVDEVSGGSYERQLFTPSSPSSKSFGNSNLIVFDNLPACTVTYIGLATMKFGGSLTLWSAITPQIVPNSARLTLAIGDVVWTL